MKQTCRGTAACRAQFAKPQPHTISEIIRSYKSAVRKQAREQTNNPDFKIWQRNYYEHIIRNGERTRISNNGDRQIYKPKGTARRAPTIIFLIIET